MAKFSGLLGRWISFCSCPQPGPFLCSRLQIFSLLRFLRWGGREDGFGRAGRTEGNGGTEREGSRWRLVWTTVPSLWVLSVQDEGWGKAGWSLQLLHLLEGRGRSAKPLQTSLGPLVLLRPMGLAFLWLFYYALSELLWPFMGLGAAALLLTLSCSLTLP